MERMLRGLDEREDAIAAVMTSVAESLASKHLHEVAGLSAEELAAQVTTSLRAEGILEAWRTEADGIHLVNGRCPYHKAAEISKLPCESDRKAIEILLGQEVEQLNRIVDGAPCCEYLLRAEPAQPQIIEVR
jgi:predicted ArsR family transcriptional regulator